MNLSGLARRAAVPLLGVAIVGVTTWSWMKTSSAAHARVAAAEARPALASRGTIHIDGRVVAYPGAEVTLGTDVLGTLKRVAAERAPVKKGDVVAEIAARSEER